jgi:hypothetical protein
VNVDGCEELVAARLEEPELDEPVDVIGRARGELGELLRGDSGHGSTVDD